MRVIDLYAGVGGWSVGFKFAGFDVVKSYEWWEPAAATHHANSGSEVVIGDIRKLNLATLPNNIDVVIGSPPCTQFSYSNRGGSGDLSDGLVDLEQFLKVVKFLKPKAWAFENVPRVKGVLERELRAGGALENYSGLFKDAQIEIFDIAEYGVPQRRKRCIAGNFDFELLKTYTNVMARPTLGGVVDALRDGKDPIFANISLHEIADNEPEEPLNWEEERFNRDMKVAHPVYNGMPFPDPLDRSSRTVTATCTRVSRESLIIQDSGSGGFRRLSVRERASLQSFPVKFQFLGKSHAQKLKMIGNAIPPVFTYLIGEAIKGTSADQLLAPEEIDANSILPDRGATKTQPDNSGRTYPLARRFRFSIPNLHFKSGTRFELSNIQGPNSWEVAFYFGDSKHIHRRKFDFDDVLRGYKKSSDKVKEFVDALKIQLDHELDLNGLDSLQGTWSHRIDGLHPFTLIDRLGCIVGKELDNDIWQTLEHDDLEKYVHEMLFGDQNSERLAIQKISKYLHEITVGTVLAAHLNETFLGVEQR